MDLRFLVVDDDPAITSVLGQVISHSFRDCEVRTATNNAAAFDILKVFTPTLITTDLARRTGQSDGYSLFTRLRELPKTAHTPVVLISARASIEELKAYRHGFNAVLLKPFTVTGLIDCISRVLQLRTNPDTILIHLGVESQALDYKATIDISDRTSRAAIAKDVIAMANWGGGAIVVGVAEPRPGEFVPEGLPTQVVESLETSRVSRAVQQYLDPPVALMCRRVRDGIREFIVINVPAARESLVLAAKKNERARLYPGRVYSRTANAESAEVRSSAELRDLLSRLARREK